LSDKISNKDKRDWKNFITSGDKLEDKDRLKKDKTSIKTKSIDLHGFTLEEAANVLIYPQYDNAGGLDSERTFIKQLVQKYIPTDANTDDLFNIEEGEETAE